MSVCGRPRSSSLLTQAEYSTYCLTRVDFTVPESDFEHGYTWSSNDGAESQPSEGRSSSSSSLTDDSVEICYSPLEMKHFETAVNRGAFSEASYDKKRERRRSYNSLCKKLSFDTAPKQCEALSSSYGEYLPCYERRRRASSVSDSKLKNSSRRKISPHHKIRRQLAKNGIDFLDASMDLSLDEIHDLQQKFYSNLNLNEQKLADTARDKVSPRINRKRSQSFV